jgi:hypothetical protein
MLAARSKEEIVQVEEEMKRFHCGLMDAKKKLEEQSKNLVQFDDSNLSPWKSFYNAFRN